MPNIADTDSTEFFITADVSRNFANEMTTATRIDKHGLVYTCRGTKPTRLNISRFFRGDEAVPVGPL
ncbi:MAG: hypothetical protein ACKPKO_08130, partial [Candidatus Fonsibacter sp.]